MRIVDKFPERHHASTYDWNAVFDGQCRELIFDEDFKCKPYSFSQLAYKAAKVREQKVRVKIVGNSVFIQARACK